MTVAPQEAPPLSCTYRLEDATAAQPWGSAPAWEDAAAAQLWGGVAVASQEALPQSPERDARAASGGEMATAGGGAAAGGAEELSERLAQRRSRLEASAQTFESKPAVSTADASHLEGLSFDGPSVREWLLRFKTPEEDRVAELLADGLKERGPLPGHAPPQEEAARLQEMARDLSQIEEQVSAERARLGSMREGLEKREAEVEAQEKFLDLETKAEQRRKQLLKSYPPPPWLESGYHTCNVGVCGNSGVGKSLLINKLRAVQPGADGWAPVGVKETTVNVSMYAFPNERRVRLWDFPGAGTPTFPQDTYVARFGLRYLDKVLIVSAGRFTQTDIAIMQELKTHNVPYCMVRTKVDIDIWNNEKDNNLTQAETLAQIRTDLLTNNVDKPHLVSLRDTSAYDFPQLMLDVFPCLQQAHQETWGNSLGAGWDDNWAVPMVHSSRVISGIQGRWSDNMGTTYHVQGLEVHVSMQDGRAGTLTLTEMDDGSVQFQGRWRIDESSVQRIVTGELRWAPLTLQLGKPIVWYAR